MAVCPRNILALCAGVGGLELGIALALGVRGEAGRGICYVEREAAAAASLVASMEAGWLHPAPVWSDLATFDARPWRGLVHILASGDPCQDNSNAGKRAGADGERFLAPEVVRVAGECGPDLIVRENVPGNADGQLAAIVPALERLGYRVAAGIFSSAETGNTMRRERLFIMAIADGGIASDGNLQRGGELGLLAQGYGAGGGVDPVDGTECAKWRPLHGPRGKGREHALPRGTQGPDGLGSAGTTMGGTKGASRRSEQQSEGAWRRRAGSTGTGNRLPPAVIPGPTDSRWRDVLDRWPELQPALSEEEVKSHLRRGIDAMAHRVERLRATGNGVDPVAAAYAFLRLDALLAKSRAAGPAIVMAA
jgi:DNA (cytosine-5)-methyltransferase 1